MNNKLINIKLSGIFYYLLERSQLRFMNKFRFGQSIKNVTIFDQDVMLDLTDLEQKYLAVDCVREPENLVVYRAIADFGLVNTFVDIGANCGHVAASIVNNYSQVILIEPNPKLSSLLRNIFENRRNITIRECAIVGIESVGQLVLNVPVDSSGLATLGKTSFSEERVKMDSYIVKASTLAEEVKGFDLKNNAYIKIDVEGFEAKVIESAVELINDNRPIVGFEALSKAAAINCAKKFNNYDFYCARFDFLNNSGALSKSILGIFKAVFFGATIEILKFDHLKDTSLENFSQIYAVPTEKSDAFEEVIGKYAKKFPVLNLQYLKTWSLID